MSTKLGIFSFKYMQLMKLLSLVFLLKAYYIPWKTYISDSTISSKGPPFAVSAISHLKISSHPALTQASTAPLFKMSV